MDPLNKIIQSAKQNKKTIVLPESEDSRMLSAADEALRTGIAEIVLLGNADEISKRAKDKGYSLDGASFVDYRTSGQFDSYLEEYCDLRKHKGMTKDQGKAVMENPLFYGAMMLRKGEVDGMVAGAVNTTANVLRASIQIVGTAKGIKTVSSCFLMILPHQEFGQDGALLYADCGVVPDPNVEQLVDIAAATGQSCRALVGVEPRIAMLAFSTYGSAKHPIVDKVIEATKLAKQRYPDLVIDGELQGDAALVASVGEKKAPNSPVAGNANTLIFPDLNAGNIAYKLTQRLAKADAIGPLLQGVGKPVNDLSRGCSAEDIVDVTAIAVLMKG